MTNGLDRFMLSKALSLLRRITQKLYRRTRIVVFAVSCQDYALKSTGPEVVRKKRYEDDLGLLLLMKENHPSAKAEIRRRQERGDLCYQVWDGTQCIHYSWMSEHRLLISEIGFSADLCRGQRWIYDGYTESHHRGQNLFPNVLKKIVQDCKEERVETVWIGSDNRNFSSLIAILKAGFIEAVMLEKTILGPIAFGRKKKSIQPHFDSQFSALTLTRPPER